MAGTMFSLYLVLVLSASVSSESVSPPSGPADQKRVDAPPE